MITTLIGIVNNYLLTHIMITVYMKINMDVYK